MDRTGRGAWEAGLTGLVQLIGQIHKRTHCFVDAGGGDSYLEGVRHRPRDPGADAERL